jgi:hypothetical protein
MREERRNDSDGKINTPEQEKQRRNYEKREKKMRRWIFFFFSGNSNMIFFVMPLDFFYSLVNFFSWSSWREGDQGRNKNKTKKKNIKNRDPVGLYLGSKLFDIKPVTVWNY